MKEKRGITLIALIITIIVMLILLAVTINVALQEGLIGKAKTASYQTQIEANKESLMLAVLGATDKNGNVVLQNIITPEGFEKISDGIYTKDRYTYTVDPTTGKITETKGTPTPIDPAPITSTGYRLTFTNMASLTESDYNTLDTEEINLMIFYPSTYNSLSEAMDDDANISVLLITEKDGEYAFRYAPDGDVANGEYYIFTTYLNHWVHGTGEADALINKPEYTDPITIPGGEEYATSSIKIATPEEIHELDDEATVISEALLRKIFTIVEVNN